MAAASDAAAPAAAAAANEAPLSPAAAEAKIKELEARAMAAHKQAQELNKQQRFAEAKAKYDEMRRLDARALALSNSLGCPSCRPAAAEGAKQAAAAAAAGPEYTQLQPVAPWPGRDAAAAAARARGAVLGWAAADAAACPVQWVYDVDKISDLLAARRSSGGPGAGLEFYDPPQSPFLPGYWVGRPSPYGEGTLVLLRSLAAEGGLDCGVYARALAGAFGEGFEGYRNASITGFLRNHARGAPPPASGAEDAQADCVARLAPLAAAFAGHPNLMRIVAAATRTTQNTDDAEAWACAGAAVMEALVLRGCSVEEAVAAAAEELRAGSERLPASQRNAAIAGHFRQALDLRSQPHAAVVDSLGRNCHLPNAATTPLHAALHCEWRLRGGGQRPPPAAAGAAPTAAAGAAAEAAFIEAIRDALAAGGCCASRAGFAGALLGAALGPGAVPAVWLEKADAGAEAGELFGRISAARGG